MAAAAGDLFRLDLLQNDYVGVQLQFVTPTATRDISSDFSLEANPTATGWQYSECLSNGGGPLTRALQAAAPVGGLGSASARQVPPLPARARNDSGMTRQLAPSRYASPLPCPPRLPARGSRG